MSPFAKLIALPMWLSKAIRQRTKVRACGVDEACDQEMERLRLVTPRIPGWSGLLTTLLILLAACGRSPASKFSGVDSVGTRDSLESLQLTEHYVKLLRARLTAEDPYQATAPIYCEQLRIIRLLTNQAEKPLDGQNKAVRLLRAAERRAFTPAEQRAVDRVDRSLGGRVFDAQPGCDSLARAGVLGDTVILPVRPGF
jgi:hypothetical protein